MQADLRVPSDCRPGRCRNGRRARQRSTCSSTWRRSTPPEPYAELTDEDWERSLGGRSARGAPVRAGRRAPHASQPAEGASSISPTGWRRAGGPDIRGILPYYVAKMGVIALTEALALELAPDNILVNAVAPGPIIPPTGTSAKSTRPSSARRRSGAGAARMRSSRPSCCSIETEFITGETIRVDGGRHIR